MGRLQWLAAAALAVLLSRVAVTNSVRGDINLDEVNIFHLIDNALWGEVDGSFLQGTFPCDRIRCSVLSSDTKTDLMNTLIQKHDEVYGKQRFNGISVGMYNIHSWKVVSRFPHKPSCALKTHLNLVESEESYSRFKYLFDSSFPHFDGNSTTHPTSAVKRFYVSALNSSEFLPMKPFEDLVQGAVFVASTCHRGRSTTRREQIVELLARVIRVDSLGKCMTTKVGPEGITLDVGKTPLESLRLKQAAISNYLFYLAFENTYEPGYVTEKVFDALIAGVVPIFLGSAEHCRELLPAINAAVFIDDFAGDIDAVGKYLLQLSRNRSAYDSHRNWRTSFSPTNYLISHPQTHKSWPCRVCEWAKAEYVAHYGGSSDRKVVCS
jgi:hypothetical protein